MSQCFAIYYEPGANWVEDKPIGEQGLGAHVGYLVDLHDRGVVIMGGPFADGRAGLVIVTLESVEEANALIAGDPAVQAGILSATARQWSRIV